MPGIDPKIGRTKPTKASDGSASKKMCLNHLRGSAPGPAGSTKKGNAVRYPEQVMIQSTTALLPSVKQTRLPSQLEISRFGMTCPLLTRSRTSALLLKKER